MVTGSRELTVEVFLAIGAAFAAFFAFVLATRARRRIARRHALRPPDPGIDLADLHAMLQEGTITQQEFEKLKTVITRQFAKRQMPLERARGFDVLPPIRDVD